MNSSLLTESMAHSTNDPNQHNTHKPFTPENVANQTVNELLWTYSPPEGEMGSRSGQLTQAQIGVIMSDIYTSLNKDFHPSDGDIEGFIRAIKGYGSDTLSRAELQHAILKKVGHIGFEDDMNTQDHPQIYNGRYEDNSTRGENSQFFRSMTYVRNTTDMTKVDSRENFNRHQNERNFSSHPAQLENSKI